MISILIVHGRCRGWRCWCELRRSGRQRWGRGGRRHGRGGGGGRAGAVLVDRRRDGSDRHGRMGRSNDRAAWWGGNAWRRKGAVDAVIRGWSRTPQGEGIRTSHDRRGGQRLGRGGLLFRRPCRGCRAGHTQRGMSWNGGRRRGGGRSLRARGRRMRKRRHVRRVPYRQPQGRHDQRRHRRGAQAGHPPGTGGAGGWGGFQHQARAQVRPQVRRNRCAARGRRPRRRPAQAGQRPPQPLRLGGQGGVSGQTRFDLRPPRLIQPAFQVGQEPFIKLSVAIQQKP